MSPSELPSTMPVEQSRLQLTMEGESLLDIVTLTRCTGEQPHALTLSFDTRPRVTAYFVLNDALSSAAREWSRDANDDSTFTRGGRCHQMLAHLDSKGKLLRANPSAHAAHQTLVVALIIAETESRNGGLRYRRKPLVRQHVSLSQPTRR